MPGPNLLVSLSIYDDPFAVSPGSRGGRGTAVRTAEPLSGS